MSSRENNQFATEEYDGYTIPQADPNITEKEKQRIIAEAEIELQELINSIKKRQKIEE